MQVIKSRFNAVGWWGLILFLVPLPVVGGIYKLMEQSNDARLSIWQTNKDMAAMGIGAATDDFPNLATLSPWVLIIAVAVMVLGITMMLMGRDSYIQELGGQ